MFNFLDDYKIFGDISKGKKLPMMNWEDGERVLKICLITFN